MESRPQSQTGFEAEFESLWRKLLSKKWCWNRKAKTRRFGEITESAFDTLKAPTVGVDAEATAWARQQAEKRTNKSLSVEEFVSSMTGYRVLALVPPCDGLPRYTNSVLGGYVDAYAFRSQFLSDCSAIIGERLLSDAWNSKLPADTIKYGQELLQSSVEFAKSNQIDLSKVHTSDDPDSIEFKLDVVQSAGRWCVFWGERGHWLESYF